MIQEIKTWFDVEGAMSHVQVTFGHSVKFGLQESMNLPGCEMTEIEDAPDSRNCEAGTFRHLDTFSAPALGRACRSSANERRGRMSMEGWRLMETGALSEGKAVMIEVGAT